MLDLNRKPKKSQEELEFDALNDQYVKTFGTPFEFFVGTYSPSWAEAIEDIRKCLETGIPQKPPEYEKGNLY